MTDDIFADTETALPDIGLLDVGHPAGEDGRRWIRSRRNLQRNLRCAGDTHFALSSPGGRNITTWLAVAVVVVVVVVVVADDHRMGFVDAHRRIGRRRQRQIRIGSGVAAFRLRHFKSLKSFKSKFD